MRSIGRLDGMRGRHEAYILETWYTKPSWWSMNFFTFLFYINMFAVSIIIIERAPDFIFTTEAHTCPF